MTAAVREHIIRPMLALYPAPQHLRRDPKGHAAALAAYEEALATFDAATLAAGWRSVVAEHRFWVWPNPGQVAEACRHHSPLPPVTDERERFRERAIKMTDAYTDRFMATTQVAKLARREGWAAPLQEFVRETAWVQAQLICGCKTVGYATILVPPDERHRSAAEFFATYRETVAAAVERGRVRVTVPPARLREWQGGTTGRESPAGPG